MWDNNNRQENACILASLILKDNNMKITKTHIKSILEAANIKVEEYWPIFFEKKFENEALFESGINRTEKKIIENTEQTEQTEEEVRGGEKEVSEESLGFAFFD